MSTVRVSWNIWYITRYRRVIRAECKPSNLPVNFLPLYGLAEILRIDFSAICLRPALVKSLMPSFAWGEYWRMKFIDWAGDAQRCRSERRFYSFSHLEARSVSGLIVSGHSGFLNSLIGHRSLLWVFEALKGVFGVLLGIFSLAAGIFRVRIQRVWSDTFYYLQNKFTILYTNCQGLKNPLPSWEACLPAGVRGGWTRPEYD